MAMQAHGSCVVRGGDTVVLTTACFRAGAKSTFPFLPLTVDYREYTYAGGRIPGGWFKREGRPSEKEILTCRIIDRPIRPLFPDWYHLETQVIGMVFSADGVNDPDILALNGASAALSVSPIPFLGPIAGVRVIELDGNLIVNPTTEERESATLEIVLAGTRDAVMMVEAGAQEVAEERLLEAILFGHGEIQKIIDCILKLKADAGIPVISAPEGEPEPTVQGEDISTTLGPRLRDALLTREKQARNTAMDSLLSELLETIPEEEEDRRNQTKSAFEEAVKKATRRLILDEEMRLDGRGLTDVRPIDCKIQLLPRTHGSALFTRGETQALVTATLGTSQDAQIIEDFLGESSMRFMLHYNFPPFSTGEVKFLRSPSRREIGHGNLARRALEAVYPYDDENFPYTTRVVADILSSNGSSSMATVCGASLALMDAGVPIAKQIAGVAMGMVVEEETVKILTDIAGHEDHFGDMDFKVAGTRDGVTALQMDIKVGGISPEIMRQALDQARQARFHILDIMDQTISSPREEMSPYAPRIWTIFIPRDKIGDVIGSGGKIIRSIIEETGCKIEIDDDGKVLVASTDGASAERAIQLIRKYSEVPEIGKVYHGVVRRIEPYGAFVEILPGTDGLLHVSEFTTFRIKDIRQALKEGDDLDVQIIEIDDSNGKVKLSRKVLIRDHPELVARDREQYEEDMSPRTPRPHQDRGDRGDRRDRRDSRSRGDRSRR